MEHFFKNADYCPHEINYGTYCTQTTSEDYDYIRNEWDSTHILEWNKDYNESLSLAPGSFCLLDLTKQLSKQSSNITVTIEQDIQDLNDPE